MLPEGTSVPVLRKKLAEAPIWPSANTTDGPPCRISTASTVSSRRNIEVVSKNDSVGMPYSGEPISSVEKYGASPPPGKPAISMLAPVWPPLLSGHMPGEILSRSAVLLGLACLICSALAVTMLKLASSFFTPPAWAVPETTTVSSVVALSLDACAGVGVCGAVAASCAKAVALRLAAIAAESA